MKLLVLFCAVAVWLQLPSEGKAIKFRSLDFQRLINKRSNVISSEESGEDSRERVYEGSDVAASDAVKTTLRNFFESALWRELILAVASDETMADPKFRSKWKVTAEDDQEREENKSDEINEVLEEFLNSDKWKALISLSSTKAELMNPTYREQWGIDFSVDISDADEKGNFFEGPQWKVFVELSEYDDDEDRDDWTKAASLWLWMLKFGEEILSVDDDK